ncbi:O-antigen ligase family protein [Geomonas sp. Red32]|uniref:O-antigen ligase family protein n=1 Tax=Geomonas sp. Red32 TaxID=2912856 RepID=UPI00202CDAC6|nr:O-antigen ligase family protein [Geomonas sp. Red32]MCM0081379.1 O-antigen ligase family protein [Geomonas sp. Red32]
MGSEQKTAQPAKPNRKGSFQAAFKRLPVLLKLVLVFMMIIFMWNSSILGFNLAGLAWVFPFGLSLLVLIQKPNRVSFPVWVWLPWAALLLGYLILADRSLLDPRVNPLQRTAQLLCPLLIAMAVSTCRPSPAVMGAVLPAMRGFAYLLFGIIALKSGVLLTGQLPEFTDLAPEAISVTLLCTLFINSHLVTGNRRDLVVWCVLAAIPVISLTRMAMAVSLLTFPLALGPMRLSRRLAACLLIVVIAVALFFSPRVQHKMFYSGKGSLSDIGGKGFATSGRSFMLATMSAAAKDKMLTGHGTGAGESFVYRLTKFLAYPHNDWMLTFYDYGVLGVGTLLLCILSMMAHALRQLRRAPDPTTRILLLTGAAGFLPYCLMMLTDNVMVYSSFFGNLQFALFGLGYASLKANAVPVPAKRKVKARPRGGEGVSGNAAGLPAAVCQTAGTDGN